MRDRAAQTRVRFALEPDWEARFEPNSHGFRPGRSVHDAIAAIFKGTRFTPKFVLDADIAACFDRIDQLALLRKLRAFPTLRRVIRGRLKAGVWDGVDFKPTRAGTPQGGPLSPLLANVALHGFEKAMNAVSRQHLVAAVRYADDFGLLCDDLTTLETACTCAETWLAEMGLRLKPSKTHITHTLQEHDGQVGFDFLGFHLRQYRVGQYHTRPYRGAPGMKTLTKPSRRALQRHIQHLHTWVHR